MSRYLDRRDTHPEVIDPHYHDRCPTCGSKDGSSREPHCPKCFE